MCSGDEILAQHVHMQLLVEKVVLLEWYDSSMEPSKGLRLPTPLLYQSSFAQLEQIRDNLPGHLREDSEYLFEPPNTPR